MTSLEEAVRERLLSGYSVKFPCREWLQQCVQFIIEENPQMATNVEALTSEVMGQLVDFDLTEIGQPSLPGHVTSCNKAVIRGPFLCQIQAIADVSQPFYRQYQELTKTYNRDCEMGSEDPNGELNPTQMAPTPAASQRNVSTHFNNQPFNKTSEGGKRVLALKLTDGVVHVKGMELEPILCLDPLKVLPGCKVVLIHKITCRRGVLLLRPQNVRILGGKVATLIPSNTPVHLFASVLGKRNHLKSILGQNPSSVSTQNADRLALPPIEQPQDPQQPTRTSSNAICSNSSTVSTSRYSRVSAGSNAGVTSGTETGSRHNSGTTQSMPVSNATPDTANQGTVRPPTVTSPRESNTVAEQKVNASVDSLFNETDINKTLSSNTTTNVLPTTPDLGTSGYPAEISREIIPRNNAPTTDPNESSLVSDCDRSLASRVARRREPSKETQGPSVSCRDSVISRVAGAGMSPNQSVTHADGEGGGFKPMQTSTPFVPKTILSEDSTSGLEDLGECDLADLKTCQFGPPEIQMSYTAQVQCRVDTLLSPLECEEGVGLGLGLGVVSWSLRVRLMDHSATLDVAVSSQVLERVIGLSAEHVFSCQQFIEQDNPEATLIKQKVSRVSELLGGVDQLRMRLQFRLGDPQGPLVTDIAKASPSPPPVLSSN